VGEVTNYLKEMLQFLDTTRGAMMQKLSAEKAISDSLRSELLQALEEFKEKYAAARSSAK
jgi:hypothetical protein